MCECGFYVYLLHVYDKCLKSDNLSKNDFSVLNIEFHLNLVWSHAFILFCLQWAEPSSQRQPRPAPVLCGLEFPEPGQLLGCHLTLTCPQPTDTARPRDRRGWIFAGRWGGGITQDQRDKGGSETWLCYACHPFWEDTSAGRTRSPRCFLSHALKPRREGLRGSDAPRGRWEVTVQPGDGSTWVRCVLQRGKDGAWMPVGDCTAVVGPELRLRRHFQEDHMLLWTNRADGLRCGWESSLVTAQLCVQASP